MVYFQQLIHCQLYPRQSRDFLNLKLQFVQVFGTCSSRHGPDGRVPVLDNGGSDGGQEDTGGHVQSTAGVMEA